MVVGTSGNIFDLCTFNQIRASAYYYIYAQEKREESGEASESATASLSGSSEYDDGARLSEGEI